MYYNALCGAELIGKTRFNQLYNSKKSGKTQYKTKNFLVEIMDKTDICRLSLL